MKEIIVRASLGSAAVVTSAGVGLVTNSLTDRPSWGLAGALGALVAICVIITDATTVLENRGQSRRSDPVSTTPRHPVVHQQAFAQNGNVVQGGRDAGIGLRPIVVLTCLAVPAVAAVVVLVASLS